MKITRINYIQISAMLVVLILIKTNFVKELLTIPVSAVRMKIVTHNMELQKVDNFAFYNDKKLDFDYVNYYKKLIPEGEAEAAKYFGNTNNYPLDIITISTSKAFKDLFRVNPEVSLSMYDGKSIYINSEKLAPYLLVHEYTHYKMHSFCKDNRISEFSIPQWFKEGVSEYVSAPFYSNKFKDPSLKKVQAFKKLEDNKGIKDSMQKDYDVYMQSYLAIKKIVDLKGQKSVIDILMESKKVGFYKALEKEIVMSTHDFENSISTAVK